MSRRFRLQTLERLRAVRLDAAAEELGAARRALIDAELEHAALQQAVLTCVPAALADSQDVVTAGLRRDLLRERADQAAAVVITRQSEVAAAVEAWHTARAGLRAVEALHDRHRLALAESDARHEQRLIDDLAAGMPRLLGSPVGTDVVAGGEPR
ncbi:MAG: flagellar FliJ family protein [Kineosporiaceae bacterium]|nr:flagellar FliJ family protein [Kineosporiaceae bacterium]MBK7622139.1 flagellar FliJ family protein [Kineosporiaceae bacterium]MBK8074450.1 flagellar FliJ family protein [Kineosporiaceae bacterium]